ncbi:MAG: hypothetical protein M5U34_01450 [Chloroflexi bacterium]|nr:hypothetical protein [Chloroflexota bacterium]
MPYKAQIMNELRLETIMLPAAELGAENPLPPISGGRDLHAIEATPDIPDEMIQNMAYGHLPNVMPYTMQDGYTRHRQERAFKTTDFRKRDPQGHLPAGTGRTALVIAA